ncbi:MAG: hypothetical protein KF729_03995 [Sandaracinaceae bacterium]|nr:hypothetical protein [Sandaracinaceae bacterium]
MRAADARADDEVPERAAPAPTVARLLQLDLDYRRQAQAGALVTVAPEGARAWLPRWELDADGLHFTVSYSDTARAHELWHERDWVVIRWTRDGHDGHATVVTEYRGALRGARVVRGREGECRRHYGIDR